MRPLILSVPRDGRTIQLTLRSGSGSAQIILVLPDEVELVQPGVPPTADPDTQPVVSGYNEEGFPPTAFRVM
jgi:hypothetical protein